MNIRFGARVPVQQDIMRAYQFVNPAQAERQIQTEDGDRISGHQTLTLYGHMEGAYPWVSYWTLDGQRKGGLLVNGNTLYTGADIYQLLGK